MIRSNPYRINHNLLANLTFEINSLTISPECENGENPISSPWVTLLDWFNSFKGYTHWTRRIYLKESTEDHCGNARIRWRVPADGLGETWIPQYEAMKCNATGDSFDEIRLREKILSLRSNVLPETVCVFMEGMVI